MPILRIRRVGRFSLRDKTQYFAEGRAIGLLKKDGLVNMDGHGNLTLTDAGEKIAKVIYERHLLLSQLFVNIRLFVTSFQSKEKREGRREKEKSPEGEKSRRRRVYHQGEALYIINSAGIIHADA